MMLMEFSWTVDCELHFYDCRLSGRILQLETVTQTESIRRRYRYLSHFSLTTTFLVLLTLLLSSFFFTADYCWRHDYCSTSAYMWFFCFSFVKLTLVRYCPVMLSFHLRMRSRSGEVRGSELRRRYIWPTLFMVNLFVVSGAGDFDMV